jgi:hypothetical protein
MSKEKTESRCLRETKEVGKRVIKGNRKKEMKVTKRATYKQNKQTN